MDLLNYLGVMVGGDGVHAVPESCSTHHQKILKLKESPSYSGRKHLGSDPCGIANTPALPPDVFKPRTVIHGVGKEGNRVTCEVFESPFPSNVVYNRQQQEAKDAKKRSETARAVELAKRQAANEIDFEKKVFTHHIEQKKSTRTMERAFLENQLRLKGLAKARDEQAKLQERAVGEIEFLASQEEEQRNRQREKDRALLLSHALAREISARDRARHEDRKKKELTRTSLPLGCGGEIDAASIVASRARMRDYWQKQIEEKLAVQQREKQHERLSELASLAKVCKFPPSLPMPLWSCIKRRPLRMTWKNDLMRES
eukprot:NODE_1467_length_1519_cov_60.238095_g1325_i0.p1 GENE.NODE_1467_length_1519_cov_60.238095_g1325_i0~~NODE_1467_length_1519_cov_60.238095_g1325_i0.p1  ORF type:complete len:315 (-),score=56.55 NODE_1467_length_1519_cov_60.238095_g1325_i0:491-1435(-)